VYEHCRTGRRINAVSIEAEFLFWRINNCVADDFGNFLADPRIVRHDAVPLRDVTVDQVGGWLKDLVGIELIRTYIVSNESYGHIVGFLTRQPANRNGKRFRKHPESPWDREETLSRVHADDSEGLQVHPRESNGFAISGNISTEVGDLLRSRGVDEQTITWSLTAHPQEKVRQACLKFDELNAREPISNPSGLLRTLLANGFSPKRPRKSKAIASTRTIEQTADDQALREMRGGSR
jgi:hypothetical protein